MTILSLRNIAMRRAAAGTLLACAALLARGPSRPEAQTGVVRFLRFAEVEDVISRFVNSGQGDLVGADLSKASAWDPWVRALDRKVRGRIDRGTEDSISNFALYGTSFTPLPRLESFEQASSPSGDLTFRARARVHALRLALGNPGDNERVRLVSDYLIRRGISDEALEAFLGDNLRRFVAEQRDYQEKLSVGGKPGEAGDLLATRGTLFAKRGLSIDTSLLPNFALEDTLRALTRKAALAPGSIRRIAVVGPGLDFTDKRDGYDFYPLQTLQPFAVLEAVLRLKLAEPESIQVVTLDLNPLVNEHVERLVERARARHAYVVQLPRDSEAGWNAQALDYWQHFGEIIGSPTRPLSVPASLGNVTLRAVAIESRYAARLQAVDLDIVAQTIDHPPQAGFDLIVATNVLVYYDRFAQALAMASLAHLLNSGGILLSNTVLPAQHPPELQYLGRRSVSYSSTGAYGDDVVVYRRQ
jgi:hypothetical protein